MKGSSKDFTSVVGLLMKVGHKGFLIKLEKGKGIGNILRAGKDYVWFPALQIIVMVDNNSCLQVRQDGDGNWFYRKGRKNAWWPISSDRNGAEFVKLIEPHYVRFINDVMLGDADAQPEGRGVQSDSSPQAT